MTRESSTEKLSKLIDLNNKEVSKKLSNNRTENFKFNESLRFGKEFYKESDRFPKTILFITDNL